MEKYLQYILKVETVDEGLVFKSYVVITMKQVTGMQSQLSGCKVISVKLLFYSYVIAGLDMIREMVKRWWMQLKAATSKGVEPEWQRCSR